MLKDLLEKRAALAKRIRAMADVVNEQKRDFTAEERTNWDAANREYDALSSQIDTLQRAERIDAEMDADLDRRDLPGRENRDTRRERDDDDRDVAGRGSEEDRAVAMQAWALRQSRRSITERHVRACRATGIDPDASELALRLPSTSETRSMQAQFAATHPAVAARSLSAIDASAGGTLVPGGFMRSLEVAMLAFSGVRQAAEILRTDSGSDLPWPTANDTDNEGERIGENTQTNDNEDPDVGAVTFKAYKYSSKMIRVPTELLQDSAFDLASEVGRMAGERIGRLTNRENTVGTAASMPNGIVTASTLGVTAAAATTIKSDEILDLIHSVDSAYRIAPGVGFMLADSSLLVLRKLKDGNGQYIWQPGLQLGVPDRLAGYRVVVNQHMAAPASNAKTVLFGDLSKYKVREVRQIRLRRLVERYAEYDQEGFVAFFRQDGNLLDAGTHPIKHLKQAA